MSNQSPRDLVQEILNAGYSQTAVARATGIKQPTISRILSGKHKDPKSSIVDALRAFAAGHIGHHKN